MRWGRLTDWPRPRVSLALGTARARTETEFACPGGECARPEHEFRDGGTRLSCAATVGTRPRIVRTLTKRVDERSEGERASNRGSHVSGDSEA